MCFSVLYFTLVFLLYIPCSHTPKLIVPSPLINHCLFNSHAFYSLMCPNLLYSISILLLVDIDNATLIVNNVHLVTSTNHSFLHLSLSLLSHWSPSTYLILILLNNQLQHVNLSILGFFSTLELSHCIQCLWIARF